MGAVQPKKRFVCRKSSVGVSRIARFLAEATYSNSARRFILSVSPSIPANIDNGGMRGRFTLSVSARTYSISASIFNLISISGGGDVHLSQSVRLGGTVFRTARAPTTEELFSNGPHLATNQFERGDPSLGKEIATGIEAAFRHRLDHHFFTASLFYTDYENFIFEQETGEVQDGLPVFQFTAEDATFQGLEIQAGSNVGALGQFDLKIDALMEYVRAETDSVNLPRIPPLSILAGIEGDTDRINLRAELEYVASAKNLAIRETPTDDFLQTNLFFGWTAPIADQKIRLSLSVLNLFDTNARQHTSFLKDTVPLPGRNLRFAVTAEF